GRDRRAGAPRPGRTHPRRRRDLSGPGARDDHIDAAALRRPRPFHPPAPAGRPRATRVPTPPQHRRRARAAPSSGGETREPAAGTGLRTLDVKSEALQLLGGCALGFTRDRNLRERDSDLAHYPWPRRRCPAATMRPRSATCWLAG